MSAGLHTLFIAKTGLLPRRDDAHSQWFFWFIYASAVPVFILVVIGAILAPLRSRLGPLGIGLVVGAIASPLLWVLGASIQGPDP